MINAEVLHKLYEGVISNKELTTKELNGYGLNSKDLNSLIKEGKLERVKRGYYKFLDVDDLFKWGVDLIRNGKREEATKCFLKCYQIEPKNINVCLRLILENLLNKDYEQVFKYFEVVMRNANNYYAKDNNLVLYLLNNITDIPKRYKEFVSTFKKDDLEIILNDKRYKKIHEHNKIRYAIFQNKFSYALKLFNEMYGDEKLSIQNMIIKTLLKQAAQARSRIVEDLLKFAKEKKYKEIISYLKEEEKKHELNGYYYTILNLAEQLVNITDKGIYPNTKYIETKALFLNIQYGNYSVALQMSNEYNVKNNLNSQNDILNILLIDINNLIEKREFELNAKEECIETSNIEVNNKSISFQDIIKYLFNNDLENTFKGLTSYLKCINQSKYEFLVVNLIKLSLIEKDGTFTKPITLLSYLSKNNFIFDLSSYIQEFYITLSQNRFEESKIYLDIIKNADKLGQDILVVENLSKALDNALKMNNSVVKNVGADTKVYEQVKEEVSAVMENFSDDTLKEEVTETLLSPSLSACIDEENIISDSEVELIRKNYELLLREKGVVLLDPMDEKKCKKLIEISQEYLNLCAFLIKDGNDNRVVLRYKKTKEEYVDINALVAKAKRKYRSKNYKECIDAWLKCLQVGNPPTYIYAKLGLLYFKCGMINNAIDYLVIATSLAFDADKSFDFTNLVGVLRKEIKPEDKKAYVKMSLDDFIDDTDNYYGIQDVDKITTYILESHLDIDSACKDLGMSEEEINILRLIYARMYYRDGYFKKGDEFLKVVEKSQNKTKFVINLLNEIRRRKRFYINESNNIVKLSLALK